MPLKALIIDDEPAARSELRFLLESRGDVTVVGEAASATEALALVRGIPYDIVFVDINMPGLNGLDFAAEMKSLDQPPAVVFVTAYSEHAVRAFDLEALDYLVKPVAEERLASCIERARRVIRGQAARAPEPAPSRSRLFVDVGEKKVAVDFGDIVYFEALDDYARLHTEDDSYLVQTSLKELSGRLTGHGFLRVHRKYLVNVEKVGEIVTLSRSAFILRMNDRRRSEIPVSRRRSREVREALGL